MGYTKQAAIGVGWMGALKVIIRGIGFVRIFILARLLLPSDFGLFGIAGLVLAFLEIFTETGINIFLIQSDDKDILKKYVHTAWVVSIVRGFIMFVVIALLAHPLAEFFEAPRSVNLLLLIATVPLIKGFINPSIVTFRRSLQFQKEFLLRSSLMLIDSGLAIGYALYSRSAESLVIGLIAAAAFEVLFSFAFIKPRPSLKFDGKKFKEIIGSGKWITLNGIWAYIAQQGDDAVVGKILNSAQLGYYQLAYKFSLLPGSEITSTVQQVVFPVYSKIAGDKQRLRRAYFKSLLLISVLAIPMGLVLFIFAEPIIFYTVGENWMPAAQALKPLALFGMIGSLVTTENMLFYAVKRQDLASNINLLKAIVLVIAIVPLTMHYGIVGAGYASLLSLLAIVPPTIFYVKKVLYE